MSATDEISVNLTLDPSLSPGGAYANVAAVWHTPHEFTVDFVSQPIPPQADADTQQGIIVSRVKIPVTAMFGIVQAMSNQIGVYEDQFGSIPAGGDS